jgi:hypothetical protein
MRGSGQREAGSRQDVRTSQTYESPEQNKKPASINMYTAARQIRLGIVYSDRSSGVLSGQLRWNTYCIMRVLYMLSPGSPDRGTGHDSAIARRVVVSHRLWSPHHRLMEK